MINDKIETIPGAIIGDNIDVLEGIKDSQTNIAIWERDIAGKVNELKEYVDGNNKFPPVTLLKGNLSLIETELKKSFTSLESDIIDWLLNDIINITGSFCKITGEESITFLLARISTSMCKRFHCDSNKLRLLCTYTGPGTEWLFEDNVDREALEFHKDNELIVKNTSEIQQLSSGDTAIIKGSNYGNSAGLVHRSPELNTPGISRLLLRLDTH